MWSGDVGAQVHGFPQRDYSQISGPIVPTYDEWLELLSCESVVHDSFGKAGYYDDERTWRYLDDEDDGDWEEEEENDEADKKRSEAAADGKNDEGRENESRSKKKHDNRKTCFAPKRFDYSLLPISSRLTAFPLMYSILLFGESPSSYLSSLVDPFPLLSRIGSRASSDELEKCSGFSRTSPPPASFLRPPQAHKSSATYNSAMKACVLEECRAAIAESLAAKLPIDGGLAPPHELPGAGGSDEPAAFKQQGCAFLSAVVQSCLEIESVGNVSGKKRRRKQATEHSPAHDLAVLSVSRLQNDPRGAPGPLLDLDGMKVGGVLLLIVRPQEGGKGASGEPQLFLAGVYPSAAQAQDDVVPLPQDVESTPAQSRSVTVITFPDPSESSPPSDPILRLHPGQVIELHPLTSLTSFVRMYDALARDVLGRSVPTALSDMILCRGSKWRPLAFEADHTPRQVQSRAVPKHTRFDDEGKVEGDEKDVERGVSAGKGLSMPRQAGRRNAELLYSHPHCSHSQALGVNVPGPALNAVQESVCRDFLADVLWDEDRAADDADHEEGGGDKPGASPRSKTAKLLAECRPPITLVQGPPGTGKTTFLSNVVYRLLHLPPPLGADKQPKEVVSSVLPKLDRCILVAAPTNKAVTVVASRILSLLDEKILGENAADKSLPSPAWAAIRRGTNVAFVGVEAKIVGGPGSCDFGGVFVWNYVDFLAARVGDIIKVLNDLMDRDVAIVRKKAKTRNSADNEFRSMTTNEKEAPHGRLSLTQGLTLTDVELQVSKLVAELERFIESEIPGNYARSGIGNEFAAVLASTSDSLVLLSALESLRSAIDTRLERTSVAAEKVSMAPLIFSTLVSSGQSIMKRNLRIHTLIVDEAAACVEPEFLVPLFLSPRRIMLVGDPGQLPALVSSKLIQRNLVGRGSCERSGAFEESIMERMITLGKAGGGYECTILNLQYRMHPEISRFPSRQFYDGALLDALSVVARSTEDVFRVTANPKEGPFTVLDTEGRCRESRRLASISNWDEAALVVAIVKVFVLSYVRRSVSGRSPWHDPSNLRVITFYAGQVGLLKQLFEKQGLGATTVGTVDSNQGSESDVVIISCVRSNEGGSSTSRTGFLRDPRRLNVSITRAKSKLIVVGDLSTLSSGPPGHLSDFVADAKSRDGVVFNASQASVAGGGLQGRRATNGR